MSEPMTPTGDWCDLVIEPWAGAHVAETFAYARSLCALLHRSVLVRGNHVAVVVTPQMDEAVCRAAYEGALESASARERDEKEGP